MSHLLQLSSIYTLLSLVYINFYVISSKIYLSSQKKHDKNDIKKSFNTKLKGLAFVIHGLSHKKINVLALYVCLLVCVCKVNSKYEVLIWNEWLGGDLILKDE